MRAVRVSILIIVVLAAVLGLGWLIKLVIGWLSGQDAQVVAAAIAFFGTVVGGIGTMVISQQRTKTREIAEAHRPNKTKLYTSFITKVVGLLRESAGKPSLDAKLQRQLEDFFFDFTTQLMLWGSPGVLTAYSVFRTAGENPKIILLVDDVLQAMRKDLGLSNWGLGRGDLMKLLLTDPEKVDEVLKGGSGN